MGQAKQRGTKEQRVAQAIELERVREAKAIERDRARPVSGLRNRQVFGSSQAGISLLAIAAGLNLGNPPQTKRPKDD